ncbi:MAG: SDR family oxidoreductase [Anaerolineales bacterium]|nr:SDR family oxidoreductase [Anaerolineales bacterium]
MKLLLPGASGLLGVNFAQEMMSEHEIIGLDRGKLINAPFKVLRRERLDASVIDSILDSESPEAVVNCAALANLEDCEENPELAKQINVDLPRVLAQACKSRNISFVHVSTDAVFDGKKDGAYNEADAPNPVGVYSRTKLEGEQAVLAEYAQAVVARVNFYGWSLGGRRSLAEFFVNSLSAGENVNGFTDVIFCPMWVNHTARILVNMLERGLSGVYHVVGAQPMSKHQFGVDVARRFGLPEGRIAPKSVEESNLRAKRSHNLWLSTRKLSADLGEELPSFSAGLDGFYAQFRQGYPQKIRSYQQK